MVHQRTGPEPIHLRPTAELAERVLLPGDPGRALALAQLLLEGPRMFNHHRGLWGYTGRAVSDGEPLSIQSTGMGGPSAAIVLHELITLGARRAIRVGTCGALDGDLALGDLVVAHEALAADGTSRTLGASERVAADRELTAILTNGNPASTIVSTDLFYEPDRERERRWRAAGAVAVEMEAAALFAVGERARVPVACVLAVSDVFAVSDVLVPLDESELMDERRSTSSGRAGHRERIDDDALQAAAEAMGRLALGALT